MEKSKSTRQRSWKRVNKGTRGRSSKFSARDTVSVTLKASSYKDKTGHITSRAKSNCGKYIYNVKFTDGKIRKFASSHLTSV